MKRVIDFEFKKNIYDVKRLILFGVSFLTLLLLFVFMITKVFEIIPHDPHIRNLEYSQSYIDFLTTKREYYYEEYLIQIGQLPQRPGEIFIKSDPNELLKLYRYYDFLLENRPSRFMESYSNTHCLFMPSSYGVQIYIYMIMPLFMFGSVYHVFREEKKINFDKNYTILVVDKKKMYVGKIIYSFISLSLIYVVLNLFAFIFLPYEKVLMYANSTYFLTNTYAIYFQKMIEMYISLTPFYIVLLMLEKWLENDRYYFLVSSLFSITLLPGIAVLFQSVVTNSDNNTLMKFPFLNLLCSEGFIDGNAIFKIIGPVFVILAVYIVDYGIKKYKESKKGV